MRVNQLAVAKLLLQMGGADMNFKVPPCTQSPLEVAAQFAPEFVNEMKSTGGSPCACVVCACACVCACAPT